MYVAKHGRVYVYERGRLREVSTPLTANGRDLERFERALAAARLQRQEQRAAKTHEGLSLGPPENAEGRR